MQSSVINTSGHNLHYKVRAVNSKHVPCRNSLVHGVHMKQVLWENQLAALVVMARL